MKPNYKNWIPRRMLAVLFAITCVPLAAFLYLHNGLTGAGGILLPALEVICILLFAAGMSFFVFCMVLYRRFDYNGERQLSRQIVEGTAAYVNLPEGGYGLDVGCGSGALTIACAKRNPRAVMLGIDKWGMEYSSFSRELCENNAKAEGVTNAVFQKGDAVRLDFPDETFDAVTSNYVYHNIMGHDKQALLLETLRVLKKGGIFVIHDIMSASNYGDMDAFIENLLKQGFEEAYLIDTTDGKFMSPKEAKFLMLSHSALLVGKK